MKSFHITKHNAPLSLFILFNTNWELLIQRINFHTCLMLIQLQFPCPCYKYCITHLSRNTITGITLQNILYIVKWGQTPVSIFKGAESQGCEHSLRLHKAIVPTGSTTCKYQKTEIKITHKITI